MNRLIITGNVGHDATAKAVNDKYVYKIALGVKSGFGDKATTEWYDCDLWRNDDKLQFTKGQKLLIEGEPTLQVWQGKDGNPAGKICVRVTNFEYLSAKQEQQPTLQEVNEAQKGMANAYNAKRQQAVEVAPEQGDLPF